MMDENTVEKWTIGLCDDTYLWYLCWEKNLSAFLAERGETADLLYFPDAASLLKNEQKMDVLFLDICLEVEPDGIWLAERLKEKHEECKIVYLTNYLTYAVDVYHTEHSYFVLKEQFQQRLGDVFEKLRAQKQQETMCFSVLNGRKLILRPEEIHYFERKLHTTRIVADSGTYLIRDKLDTLEKLLPGSQLLRCHNSYIVNLTYVREMCKGYFLLKDQTIIQISRSYTRSVKERFLRWAMNEMGGLK